MYRAKEIGNEYQFFSSDMNNRVRERLVLQAKIRAGLLAQEFIVYYQPQLNALTGTLVGMEALVRWDNRQEGLIGPDRFIALAEETGLIHQIGEQVFRMSCVQGKRWRDEGLASGRIAINVSANQLRRPGFVGLVESIVKESGFPPEFLEIELTENALIEDIPETTSKLHKLKSFGISLAIDDFGTKYSSLASTQIWFTPNLLSISSTFLLVTPSSSALRSA